jgi:FtsP/CotA-like multicopper oxidase with cupredoxin domain
MPSPPVIASRDGLLDVTLVAAPGIALAGRRTQGWGYNGRSPGPTLRVRPGDLLRIRLVNRLQQPTNLHTHGLHVPPDGHGDNPFVAVAPGESFDYAIRIPADHPVGTYWYHPHHHGTAAGQVFAGLVGVLLVERDPYPPVTADRVLMVTDTTLDGDGDVVAPDAMARMMGRLGELVLVNGEHRPVVHAAAGALERWRLVNGCASRVLVLSLQGHRLTQIALDGAFLPAPLDCTEVVLAPGNRGDVLVRPAREGAFEVVSRAFLGGAGMMGRPRAESVTLATLSVIGVAGSPYAVPGTLPAPADPAGPVTRRRRLVLSTGHGGMGMDGMAFTIDGRTFDPDRDDQVVDLGTTEEWTIVNDSPMAHPFHLHGWPLRTLAGAVAAASTAVRQDVALVPAGGRVTLRIAFTDFGGRGVYHCHTLDHEDLGMMGVVRVR